MSKTVEVRQAVRMQVPAATGPPLVPLQVEGLEACACSSHSCPPRELEGPLVELELLDQDLVEGQPELPLLQEVDSSCSLELYVPQLCESQAEGG